jgi:hypothetical protein
MFCGHHFDGDDFYLTYLHSKCFFVSDIRLFRYAK